MTPDLHARVLAKVDEIEKKAWRYVSGVIIEDSLTSVFRALRVAIEMHGEGTFVVRPKTGVKVPVCKCGTPNCTELTKIAEEMGVGDE